MERGERVEPHFVGPPAPGRNAARRRRASAAASGERRVLFHLPGRRAAREQYATLAARSPDALRRLAAFYRGRGLAADEVRALDALASALPPAERVPVYRRVIDAINDARPAGLTAEPYYARILEVDANDVGTLHDYVSLLLSAGDSSRALQAIDRAAAAAGYRTFAMRRAMLSERARVYDQIGSRKAALEVYERQFDPRWPRAIVSDYDALLSRDGLYRERRRSLQAEAARSGASLARIARLFNVYEYEGNLPAAAGLLASLERARAGA